MDSFSSEFKCIDNMSELSSRVCKPSLESLGRTSRHFGSTSTSYKKENLDTFRKNGYVINSSGNTTGSLSDDDLGDPTHPTVTDPTDRVGVLDYFDHQYVSNSSIEDEDICDNFNQSTIQKEQSLNDKAYDAAFDADTDIDLQIEQQQTVEYSPNTTYPDMDFELETHDINQTTESYEMTDLDKGMHNELHRQRNNEIYDEAYSNDSDSSCEDLQSVVVHSTEPEPSRYNNLHRALYGSSNNGYSRMDSEYTEYDDYEMGLKSSLCARNSGGPMVFQSSSNYGATRTYGTNTSQNSVDTKLEDESKSSATSVKTDKPDRRYLRRTQGDIARQSGERLRERSLRENPVPSIFGPEIISNYKYSKGEVHGRDSDDQSARARHVKKWDLSKYPRDLSSLKEYMSGDRDVEEGTTFFGRDTQLPKKSRHRKYRKEVTINPQTLPGYFGDKNVDELLAIIDGADKHTSNNSNTKKKGTSNHFQAQEKPCQSSNTANPANEQGKQNHPTNTFKRESRKKKKKSNSSDSVSKTVSDVVDSKPDISKPDPKNESTIHQKTDLKSVEVLTNLTANDQKSLAHSLDDFSLSESYIITDWDIKPPPKEKFTLVKKRKKKSNVNSESEVICDNCDNDMKFDKNVTSKSQTSVKNKQSFNVFSRHGRKQVNSSYNTGIVSKVTCSAPSGTSGDKVIGNITNGSDTSKLDKITVSNPHCSIQESVIHPSSRDNPEKVAPCVDPVSVVNSLCSQLSPCDQSVSSEDGISYQKEESTKTSQNVVPEIVHSKSYSSSDSSETSVEDYHTVPSTKNVAIDIKCNIDFPSLNQTSNNLSGSGESLSQELTSQAGKNDMTNKCRNVNCQNVCTEAINKLSTGTNASNIKSSCKSDSIGVSHVASNNISSGTIDKLTSKQPAESTTHHKKPPNSNISHETTNSSSPVTSRSEKQTNTNLKEANACGDHSVTTQQSQISETFYNQPRKTFSKAVIFLDRKMNENVDKLDITFGFDKDLPEAEILNNRFVDRSNGIDAQHTSPKVGYNCLDKCLPSDKCVHTSPGMDLNHNCSDLVFMGPEQPDFSAQTSTAEPAVNHSAAQDDKEPHSNVKPGHSLNVVQTKETEHILQEQTTSTSDNTNNPKKQAQLTKDIIDSQTRPVYDKSKDPNFQKGRFNHVAGAAFLHSSMCLVKNSGDFVYSSSIM